VALFLWYGTCFSRVFCASPVSLDAENPEQIRVCRERRGGRVAEGGGLLIRRIASLPVPPCPAYADFVGLYRDHPPGPSP